MTITPVIVRCSLDKSLRKQDPEKRQPPTTDRNKDSRKSALDITPLEPNIAPKELTVRLRGLFTALLALSAVWARDWPQMRDEADKGLPPWIQ